LFKFCPQIVSALDWRIYMYSATVYIIYRGWSFFFLTVANNNYFGCFCLRLRIVIVLRLCFLLTEDNYCCYNWVFPLTENNYIVLRIRLEEQSTYLSISDIVNFWYNVLVISTWNFMSIWSRVRYCLQIHVVWADIIYFRQLNFRKLMFESINWN
jgi:hypothetical protein